MIKYCIVDHAFLVLYCI